MVPIQTLSNQPRKEASLLCIVHTEMESDARNFALGLRLSHKDAALRIGTWSKPEEVLPPNSIETHGMEFCLLVINEIARMNHVEVSDFATDFSMRYQANPQQLLHAITQPISELFTKEERVRHGDTFLKLVMHNCEQALVCLKGAQLAHGDGAIPQSQTETSQSTRTDSSRNQMGISRGTHTDISRGTQTDITSGTFSRLLKAQRLM
jgi:hypothetical protein